MEYQPIKVQITNETLDFIRDHHLMCHSRDNLLMPSLGGVVEFDAATVIEPYVGYYPFKKLFSSGCFSYSHSTESSHLHLSMGRYCSIAGGMQHLGFNHPTSYISTSPFTYDSGESFVKEFILQDGGEYMNFYPAPQKSIPKIEHDVWIGSNVILAPGITIQTGAIISANSLCMKDIGPYEIWGGNPAKFIKHRIPQEIINSMLSTEWWQYKFTDFKFLSIDDPFKFCNEFEERKKSLEIYQPVKIRLIDMPGLRV